LIAARARRLQLFTGKGGVGKTTLVAALALAWAERGRKPLIVELGHRASVEDVLASPPVGWEPVAVGGGAFATNVVAERAIVEAVAGWLRMRRLAARALRSDAMRAFVGAAPAVVEVATTERISALLAMDWDPILVDADASGHALMFLGAAGVLAELGAGGPLARGLAVTRRLFADPERAALHLVTVADALPVQETIELDAALRGRDVALGCTFVREVRSADVDAALVRALAAKAAAAAAEGLAADLGHLADDVEAAREARARVARLAEATGRELVEIPRIDAARPSHAELLAIGRRALAS
jgi:hypothetical protein